MLRRLFFLQLRLLPRLFVAEDMALSLNALKETGKSGQLAVVRKICWDPELPVAMQRVGVNQWPIPCIGW
jgi:hypothetical protein